MTSAAPMPTSDAARIASGTTAAPVTGSLLPPPPDAPGAAAFGVVFVDVTFFVVVDFSVCFGVLDEGFADFDGFGSPDFDVLGLADFDVLGLAESEGFAEEDSDVPGPPGVPGSDDGSDVGSAVGSSEHSA